MSGLVNSPGARSGIIGYRETIKPTENFGHDSANTVITLTFVSGKKYLVIAHSAKTDGVYYYISSYISYI